MTTNLRWSDIAFSNKREIKQLKATFILAPRKISVARFKQILKYYLPMGNILLGISQEEFVLGLEDQPHFKMLRLSEIEHIIDQVNHSSSPYKIRTITYAQREASFLIEKLGITRIALVNGSWKFGFHHSSLFYRISKLGIPFEYISAFTDQREALTAETALKAEISEHFALPERGSRLTEHAMIQAADTAGRHSFDYNFQIGASLGTRTPDGTYIFEKAIHNKIVPYETFALLNGSVREKHFSPSHDLNHYDTVHAEVMLLISAQKDGIQLQKSSLFINLLPCPTCARMLCETDISEVVYQLDHSDGYGLRLLESAGKTVRRIVKPS